MSLEFNEFKRFLGKHIRDNYGRTLGRVVGLIVDVNQQVTDVEVEFGNGEFLKCPSKQFSMESGTLVYLYPWELESIEIAKALDLAIKRIQALDELFRMGEIPTETYDEFKKIHEASLKELKDKRDNLIARLKSRVDKLNAQIRELQMFRTSLKMQKSTAEISEDVFKDAISIVEDGLTKSFNEKEQLEHTIARLSKLDFKQPSAIKPEVKPVVPKIEVGSGLTSPSIEGTKTEDKSAKDKKEGAPINVKVVE
jgi:sporulation protein YlmC with PRC-barrel domain